ncbi:MAG TPA: stage II sporulation protein M [Pseudomonas sp.]|nr:stage II sporulation protein M [Pseudomonas sp.]
MKQARFEALHQGEWQALDGHLQQLEQGRSLGPAAGEFAAAYRRLCQQLALAESRAYGPALIERLQLLTLRAHQQLYRPRQNLGPRLLGFLLAGFPRQVRAAWRSILLASLLFYGSLLGMVVLVNLFPDLVYSVLSPAQVIHIEQMYDPDASRLGPLGERGSSGDWLMFGYYIMNNIGIAFQTFAGGLLLGVGTLFFLLFNGVNIGAIAGHLLRIGYDETFLSFVVGHSAFELTAITFAGAAGLQLGGALLMPGPRSRRAALHAAAKGCIGLVCGVIGLLLIAAFVEAYWSSIRDFSAGVKYAVGALLWLLVGAYFLLGGRRA